MRVVNVPTLASGTPLVGVVGTHGTIRVLNGEETPIGRAVVCEFHNLHPEALARDIAWAMEAARNQGYAQAQADMRRALGVK